MLEMALSHCPALTDLSLSSSEFIYSDSAADRTSCGVAEQTLDSMAAHLLHLKLDLYRQWDMDLLVKLSLHFPRLTDLSLFTSGESPGLSLLIEALPRLHRLTAFSFRDINVTDPHSCRYWNATVHQAIAALPAAASIARQIRSLDVDGFSWDLKIFLQHLPPLDRLRVKNCDRHFVAELRSMALEERAKGNGGLELTDSTSWIAYAVRGRGWKECESENHYTRDRQSSRRHKKIGTLFK